MLYLPYHALCNIKCTVRTVHTVHTMYTALTGHILWVYLVMLMEGGVKDKVIYREGLCLHWENWEGEIITSKVNLNFE